MMARDRASIRTDIWADAHWRSLTHDAQWLYEFILAAGVNLCGVADWRPAKWSGMARDITKQSIERWALELEQEHFVVIDRDTEEVLVRSFFRHDGILSQPNPMKGAAREFASIGSQRIQGVIAHELNRLLEEYPDGIGKANVWNLVPELRTLLRTPPVDVRDPLENPSRNPSPNPSGNPSDTYTSTYTSTEASLLMPIEDEQRPRSVDEYFDDFWAVWGKRVSKGAALKAFRSTLNGVKPAQRPELAESIISAVPRAFAAWSREARDLQKIPYPATWLNAQGWLDDFDAATPITYDRAKEFAADDYT